MIMSAIKRIHDKVEVKLFGDESRPAVKVLEFLIVSGCPYCSAIRAMMFGYGVGIGGLFGMALVVLAVAFNHLEKWIRDE